MKNVIFIITIGLLVHFNASSQILVKDIAPGLTSSNPHKIWPFNNGFVFGANDGFNGTELYYSDGTENGTVVLTNLYNSNYASYVSYAPGGVASAFIEIDNYGYFFGYVEANKVSFFRTDGTIAGTEILIDSVGIGLSRIFKMSNKICFLGSTYTAPYWTPLLYKFDPVLHSSSIVNVNNNSMFFSPFQNQTNIKDLSYPYLVNFQQEQYIAEPFVFNNKLFGIRDSTICSLDINGTVTPVFSLPAVTTITNNTLAGNPLANPIVNNKYIFKSFGTNIESELYYFDFASQTGGLLKDINPYFDYGSNVFFAYLPHFDWEQHQYLYFAATTENYGREVWVTDGTPSGTHIVEDYYVGPVWGFESSSYGDINRSVYYGDTLILYEHRTISDNNIFYLTADVSGIHENNYSSNVSDNFFQTSSDNYPLPNVEDFNSFDDMYFESHGYDNIDQTYDTVSVFTRFSDFNNPRGYLTLLSCVNSNTTVYPNSLFKIGCNIYFITDDCDFTGKELFKYDLCSFTSGVSEVATSNLFSISPNPATTQLNIKTDNAAKTDYSIYDVTGRILNTGTFNQNTTISINDFAQGNYFIQLTNNQNTTTQKFIKQ